MTTAPDHQRFAIPDILTFEDGPGGLTMVTIRNHYATARIALHGAHLLDYQPRGRSPVLWMSSHSAFADGQPIRGGIPICWPWFGAHPDDPDLPAHGLARLRAWEPVWSEHRDDGQTDLILRLNDDAESQRQWPHSCTLEHHIRIGHHLDCRLTTTNTGAAPVTISTALHSYFAVSAADTIRVRGLSGRRYADRLQDDRICKQRGPVVIEGETDRLYLDTEDICYLDDPALNRCIVIAKEGSRSTVVWNPWIAKAARLPDFGDEEYRDMLCIETCNAGPDAITLEPGASHRLRALINVEAFGFDITEDAG